VRISLRNPANTDRQINHNTRLAAFLLDSLKIRGGRESMSAPSALHRLRLLLSLSLVQLQASQPSTMSRPERIAPPELFYDEK